MRELVLNTFSRRDSPLDFLLFRIIRSQMIRVIYFKIMTCLELKDTASKYYSRLLIRCLTVMRDGFSILVKQHFDWKIQWIVKVSSSVSCCLNSWVLILFYNVSRYWYVRGLKIPKILGQDPPRNDDHFLPFIVLVDKQNLNLMIWRRLKKRYRQSFFLCLFSKHIMYIFNS
jgi:hypothetical protein